MVSKVFGKKKHKQTEQNPATNKPNQKNPQYTPKPQITNTTNLGFPASCELYPLNVTANLQQSNLLAGS